MMAMKATTTTAVQKPAKIKLTQAQLRKLQERSGFFVPEYKPGLKLMELGLIDAIQSKSGWTYKWTINEAGEKYLHSIHLSE